MLLTGAEIVIECLKEQGVDTVFGYPGGTILNIYDALYSHSEIRHILTSHEQGASHAADGYARSTGKVGVVFATSGPGATNLVTGIATAYMDSSPIVAITCNVPTTLLGKDSFQEIDITGVTMPITKHNYIVHNVEELADVIREAFIIAKSGRPGPVLIVIPKEVTANEVEFEPLKNLDEIEKRIQERNIHLKRSLNPPSPSDEEIKKAADIINNAKRPVIYAGGGIIIGNASEELLALYSVFLLRENRLDDAGKVAGKLRGSKYASIYSEYILRDSAAKSSENNNAYSYYLSKDFQLQLAFFYMVLNHHFPLL